MLEILSRPITVIILAFIFGLCNALDEMILEASHSRILFILIGSPIFGGMLTLGVVYLVL
jgi:hypothetical protein